MTSKTSSAAYHARQVQHHADCGAHEMPGSLFQSLLMIMVCIHCQPCQQTNSFCMWLAANRVLQGLASYGWRCSAHASDRHTLFSGQTLAARLIRPEQLRQPSGAQPSSPDTSGMFADPMIVSGGRDEGPHQGLGSAPAAPASRNRAAGALPTMHCCC